MQKTLSLLVVGLVFAASIARARAEETPRILEAWLDGEGRTYLKLSSLKYDLGIPYAPYHPFFAGNAARTYQLDKNEFDRGPAPSPGKGKAPAPAPAPVASRARVIESSDGGLQVSCGDKSVTLKRAPREWIAARNQEIAEKGVEEALRLQRLELYATRPVLVFKAPSTGQILYVRESRYYPGAWSFQVFLYKVDAQGKAAGQGFELLEAIRWDDRDPDSKIVALRFREGPALWISSDGQTADWSLDGRQRIRYRQAGHPDDEADGTNFLPMKRVQSSSIRLPAVIRLGTDNDYDMNMLVKPNRQLCDVYFSPAAEE